MDFLPLYDKIVVERDEAEEQVGSIYIPDQAQNKPQQGTVLAVGIGRIDSEGDVKPLQVKVGDRIVFGEYSGTEIEVNEQVVLIMREDEVLGVLKR